VLGFDWDPHKKQRNVKERGIDFTMAARIWDGPVIERVDSRYEYGEERIIATGELDGRLMVVVFTWRGNVRRIISARKANPRE
jgi:uncharacterized protein